MTDRSDDDNNTDTFTQIRGRCSSFETPWSEVERTTSPHDEELQYAHDYFDDALTIENTWGSWLVDHSPMWLPPFVFKRSLLLMLSNKSKGDDDSIHTALCEDIQIHLFLDMFFATIIAAPLLGENSTINEAAISSFREGVFKCMLLGTLHLEVASITCQALCYSAVIAVPRGSMALWMSKRIGAVQFVLCLHMCSFYAFIATIIVYPLLTRHDNVSVWPWVYFAQGIIMILVMTTRRVGVLPLLTKTLSPLAELPSNPHDKYMQAQAKIEHDDIMRERAKQNAVYAEQQASRNSMSVRVGSESAGPELSPKSKSIGTPRTGDSTASSQSGSPTYEHLPLREGEGGDEKEGEGEEGEDEEDNESRKFLESQIFSDCEGTTEEGSPAAVADPKKKDTVQVNGEMKVSTWLALPHVTKCITNPVEAYIATFEKAHVSTLHMLYYCTDHDYRECGVSIGDRIAMQLLLKGEHTRLEDSRQVLWQQQQGQLDRKKKRKQLSATGMSIARL